MATVSRAGERTKNELIKQKTAGKQSFLGQIVRCLSPRVRGFVGFLFPLPPPLYIHLIGAHAHSDNYSRCIHFLTARLGEYCIDFVSSMYLRSLANLALCRYLWHKVRSE